MGIIEALRAAAKLLVLDEKSVSVLKWKVLRGDTTLRLNYELTPESVVFDVGGYHGDWANQIASRYDSHIHIFEPVDDYYKVIERKLSANPKIVINKSGLSNKTENHLISIDEAGSSVIKLNGKVTEIKLVDIYQYVSDHDITKIDLIKINIEGSEYALLDRMHETDLIRACVDIQIQFHDFFPGAISHRNRLREILSSTHELTYDFPFIWENWHVRTDENK